MVKEKPILFKGEMVRAILAGNKTQTRRTIKIPVDSDGKIYNADKSSIDYSLAPPYFKAFYARENGDDIMQRVFCPYEQVGDLLWVKETHIPTAFGVIYRADYNSTDAAETGAFYGGWKPSIFCSRANSRILLEITDIRVERLQDISEKDAKAESCLGEFKKDTMILSPIAQFKALWDFINGKSKDKAWSDNPFVWAVEFKVVEVKGGRESA
jgi:hypothetical protein